MPLEYPTPDIVPTGTTCRSLFMPDNELFIGAVLGALKTLIEPENWQKMGALSPQESADAMIDTFDMFCFNQGVCRMIGEIVLWSGSAAPDDSRFLLCDGTHVSSADYPDLYAVIGTSFGGTSSVDFALPDLQGKVAIGQNSAHGYATSGGEETHTLDVSEIPSHSHTNSPHLHSDVGAAPNITTIGAGAPQPTAVPIVGATGLAGVSIDNTGGDGAHNNMQPFLTLNYYIVAL